MIIEGPGIKLEATLDGNQLRYKVLEQDPKTTNNIRLQKVIRDEQSGFSLRSNLKPHYSHKNSRFMVRGYETQHDRKEVLVDFDSGQKAQIALAALKRMIEGIKDVPVEKMNHKANRKPVSGGSTHVRFALVTKAQAEKLKLTAHDYYPEERTWPGKVKPILTISPHFNEHLSQIVSVLNHAVDPSFKDKSDGGDNLHRVNHKQAKAAIDGIKAYLDKAENEDWLVAAWRTLTGVRAIDSTEDPHTISKTQINECVTLTENYIKKEYCGAKLVDYDLILDQEYVKINYTVDHSGKRFIVEKSFFLSNN